jgi:cytoskeleton protein RodZ
MANGVGQTLREARRRREVELSAVEEATRIRPRFLRAIENEEWDALPGGVYTRGFIRTYAAFLGLDGDRLAEDYRRDVEGAAGGREPQVENVPAGSGPAASPRRPAGRAGWMLAVAAVVLIAALAIVVLPDGGGGGEAEVAHRPSHGSGEADGREKHSQTPESQASGMSLRLAAIAEVWVCLLAASGQHLVNGQILEAGAEEGPFHSGSFTVSFGNGEVSMFIDGKEAEIPATSSPIGYSIDSSGTLTQLSEAERPTCA